MSKKTIRNRSNYYRRLERLKRLYAVCISLIIALALYGIVIVIAVLLFSGCAPKERIVYKEVPIPYPMKCRYYLAPKAKLIKDSYRTTASSIQDIINQRDYLYESLRILPCIELVDEEITD